MIRLVMPSRAFSRLNCGTRLRKSSMIGSSSDGSHAASASAVVDRASLGKSSRPPKSPPFSITRSDRIIGS